MVAYCSPPIGCGWGCTATSQARHKGSLIPDLEAIAKPQINPDLPDPKKQSDQPKRIGSPTPQKEQVNAYWFPNKQQGIVVQHPSKRQGIVIQTLQQKARFVVQTPQQKARFVIHTLQKAAGFCITELPATARTLCHKHPCYSCASNTYPLLILLVLCVQL